MTAPRRIPAAPRPTASFAPPPQRPAAGCWASCSPAWAATASVDPGTSAPPVDGYSSRTSSRPWSGACPGAWREPGSPTPLSRSTVWRTRSRGGPQPHASGVRSDRDQKWNVAVRYTQAWRPPAMSLSEADLQFVAALVHARAAIVLDASKGYLVEARLASLTKRTGHATTTDLVSDLRASRWGELHGQVVEVMTTNETSFFRDYHPWESLRSTVIPRLIASRRKSRRLSIWCGACSSGQEPYTLAIILNEHFPELASWQVNILCSDISSKMVARTAEGRYSDLEINRGLDPQLRDRWFDL